MVVVNISHRDLVFVTHRVSTCAAMRFLVLVFCFITLSVVHAANGNPDDQDSESLGLQEAQKSPQLLDSIEELPALVSYYLNEMIYHFTV